MHSQIITSAQSRRDFLKKLIVVSPLFYLRLSDLYALTGYNETNGESPDFIYKYKTMSIDHLKELQEDIDNLKRRGKLSNHKVYRSYIDNKKFEIPENFPGARSIIVMAVFTRLMYVNFYLEGKKHEVMLPPQYYDDGLTLKDLQNTIQKDIIEDPGYKIERATKVHIKLLAARSGLGKYGRNNIIFVDGMGSFITLYAFFTDFEFKEDNWHELEMLEACKPCRICLGLCPTNCITMENFVIDVGRCITLYNEIEGKFPKWIRRKYHNALVGCMKCQLRCPENEKIENFTGRLEDVTEEETRKILHGQPDEELLKSLSEKLRKFVPATSKEYFPMLTRNLDVLIS